MGERYFAWNEIRATTKKRSKAGAMVRSAVGALGDYLCAESIERVEFRDGYLFIE